MSAPASTNMLYFYQKPRLGYLCFLPGFNPPHSQWFQWVEEAHTYQPHQWDCKMNRAEVEWMVQETFPLAAPPDSPVLESYSNSPQTWQCSFPFFFFFIVIWKFISYFYLSLSHSGSVLVWTWVMHLDVSRLVWGSQILRCDCFHCREQKKIQCTISHIV